MLDQVSDEHRNRNNDNGTGAQPRIRHACGGGLWAALAIGACAWILGCCVVMLARVLHPVRHGRVPVSAGHAAALRRSCPPLGALFVIMQARRGTLTASHTRGASGWKPARRADRRPVSVGRSNCTSSPATQATAPVLGLHLYTWALITFVIVMIYVGAALDDDAEEHSRGAGGRDPGTDGVDAGHLAVHRGGGGNVVAIIFLGVRRGAARRPGGLPPGRAVHPLDHARRRVSDDPLADRDVPVVVDGLRPVRGHRASAAGNQVNCGPWADRGGGLGP